MKNNLKFGLPDISNFATTEQVAAASAGIVGAVDTHAILISIAPTVRDVGVWVVRNDETHGNKRAFYTNTGTAYTFLFLDVNEADDIIVDAAAFSNVLSPTDINSQIAFNTIDAKDFLFADGSKELTSDWDAGSHKITAEQFESDIVTGTAPLVVASTTVVSNLNADLLDGKDSTDFVLVDGTQALTASWDVGSFKITAEQFESDIVTGTAPLVVASTTVVSNLNVDQVDGKDSTDFVLVDGTQALSSDWDAGSHKITAEQFESDIVTGTAPLVVASTTVVSNLNADLLDGNEASAFALQSANVDSKEPTGFVDRTDSTISFVDGTLTFTIQPAVASFDYYIKGTKYTVSAPDTVAITDDEGLWFIYYNGSTLTSTQVWANTLITDNSLVAILYWDEDNNTAIIFSDERHGCNMSGKTHQYLHDIFGCQWDSGLALGGFTISTGANDADAQFNCADGEVHDEDLEIEIADDTPQNLSPTAQIPMYYLEGVTPVWRKTAANNFACIPSGAGARLAYNQNNGGTWQQTAIGSNNNFVLTHLFATNDTVNPIIGIQGQNEYGTLSDARDGAESEINSISTIGLPIAEFTPIATVIFQTSTAYGNSIKARVRDIESGVNYVDWRGAGISQSSVASSHSALADLSYNSSGHSGFSGAYSTTSDPGVNNDGVDTAGEGIRIDVGHKWINSTSQEIFICTNNSTGAAVWVNVSINAIEFNISGGGGGLKIQAGYLWFTRAKYDGEIVAVEMSADQSTTTVADIWKCTYAEYDAGATHPVDGDSITAAAPPTITATVKSQDAVLSGWTTTFLQGDYFALNIDSNDNAEKLNVFLYTRRK